MLEANRCAGLHAVPVKTVDQQALQALHRVRTQWQATRTGRINVIRGLLREQGPNELGPSSTTTRYRISAPLLLQAGLFQHAIDGTSWDVNSEFPAIVTVPGVVAC